ncbi:MAG: RNA polymerase sigma factor [Amphiplicatus sp.]
MTDDPCTVVRQKSVDEARLVERVAVKDLNAFEELYRIYHPRLIRFLMNIMRRPSLVEEALNDTMLVIWNKADSYNGDSKVSTWIFGIAYRKALKAAQSNDEPVEDRGRDLRESAAPGPEQELVKRQMREALLNAMNALSADHRAVVDLAYFHDFGYREIAEIMDCPVNTVKTRMYHARQDLKKILAGRVADWL